MKTTAACPIKQIICKEDTAKNSTALLKTEIFNGIDSVNPVLWESLIEQDRILFGIDYLRAAEESNPHIEFKYATIYDQGELIGTLLFQLIKVRDGLRLKTGDKLTKTDKLVNWVKRRINGIDVSLLLCGNAFITGDFGFFMKKGADRNLFVEGINESIEKIKKTNKVNIVMVKDFRPEDLEMGRLLKNYAYNEVYAQPNMELDIRPTWLTFADYQADLVSKYRTKAKSKRKKLIGVEKRELTLDEIIEQKELIHQMYMKCSDGAEFNLTAISKDYYVELKRQLQDRFQVQGYFYEGRMIAFMSYFMEGDILESHFVGYDHQLNHKLAIYHNLLIDHVEIAINKKMKHLSYGRTALESKSNLGAKGTDLISFAWSKNWFLQTFAVQIFDSMRPVDWVDRNALK